MATCSNCHVTKEETFGWWGVITPSDQLTLCPRCFRFRALNELLVRVNEVIIEAPVDNEAKRIILYELGKIKFE